VNKSLSLNQSCTYELNSEDAMLVKRKSLFVVLLAVVLAVPVVGPPTIRSAQAAQMCSLVNWSGTYEPDNGNGEGTRSFFEAGTVLHY
jgi:hypothetical protein